MNTTVHKGDETGQEVTNLFEVYGAVDQQVEDNLRREDRDRIARALPIYKRSDAHWFKDFTKTTGIAERWDLPGPETRVDAALTRLAEIKPRGRMRTRRLFAVSTAAQAFPEIPARQLASALGPGELPDGADAEELAALLRRPPASDSQGGRDEWWEVLRRSDLTPRDIGPRPCSGQLAWVNIGGDLDLVPTLKTVFEAQLAFDDARRFCDDPETWECFPSFCSMQPINEGNWKNGIRQYQELVSFDCDNRAFPKLKINLNFFTEETDTPRRRVVTEYWLSDDQPKSDDQPENVLVNKVLVNQGWLEIEELSSGPYPRVRVTTTKSVKFVDELGGPGLASVSCRLGYMSMVGDLVTCAAKRPGEKGYPDVQDRMSKPDMGAQGKARSPDLDLAPLISMMVDETATAAEECIDEYVKGYQASYATLQSGYTADDVVRDTANAWLGMLRQGARFADVGLRVGRTRGGR